jgi:septum formation protein
MPKPLILASSSPRRRELLANAGILFEVAAADVPEVHAPGERPVDFASRLAREKARAVARTHPGRAVLGADTIMIVDDEILGKPQSAADAQRMLSLLAGRQHLVSTAVCLRTASGREIAEIETTRVYFSELSQEDIAGYVATGEPMDKAGAYAIQGLASRWVNRIEGDYFTVMGLPVALVWKMLRSEGLAS